LLVLEPAELPRGKLWGELQLLDALGGERAELLQCTVSRSSSRPRSSTEKCRKPCSDPSRNVSRANASIRLLRDMVPAAGGGSGGGGGGGGDGGGGRSCCGAGVRQEDILRTLWSQVS